MTAPDPILVLAWLVLAHLVADFVLQSGRIVAAKNSRGPRAAAGLVAHAAIVGLCLVPIGLAFGGPGWAFAAISALLHLAIDRTKIVATRRAAVEALEAAHRRHEGRRPAEQLGRAWTPVPAGLFLVDQVAHLLVAVAAWAWLLSSARLEPGWIAAVGGLIGSWDPGVVHRATSAAVVVAGLAIVNVRAAALLVAILVRPVEQTEREMRWGDRAGPLVDPDEAAGRAAAAGGSMTPHGSVTAAASGTPPRGRWSLRLGPLVATLEGDGPVAPPAPVPVADAIASAPAIVHARVGATIGILERILVVVFVLTGSEAAIGFVVAAKTLARFRLLDDREFAEYYLLGTLASVAVAIVTGLIGRAALTALLA